jgi:hypothetical protein
MFHIHICYEHYWEKRIKEKNPKCSDLMGKWFLQLPLKTRLFLLFNTDKEI